MTTPEPGKKPSQWSAAEKRRNWTILSAIAALIVGLIISNAVQGSDNNSAAVSANTTSGPNLNMERIDAFEECQAFVKQYLKSPGTAKFRNYNGSQAPAIMGDAYGPYTVDSTVDSENSFGADLRGSFHCVVTDSNDTAGDWTLQYLTFTNPDGQTEVEAGSPSTPTVTSPGPADTLSPNQSLAASPTLPASAPLTKVKFCLNVNEFGTESFNSAAHGMKQTAQLNQGIANLKQEADVLGAPASSMVDAAFIGYHSEYNDTSENTWLTILGNLQSGYCAGIIKP